MRVLLLNVTCKYSSTGKIVFDLYNRLRADGHEAAIAYGRGDIVEGENIYKYGVDAETYLHAALARVTGLNGYFSAISTRRLISFIEDFKPDVVHIHEIHAYHLNQATLFNYLKKKKIPVVYTFHCEYMYTGKCGFAYDCENYKSGCGNCKYVKLYVSSLGIDRTAYMLKQKKKWMTGLDIRLIAPPSKWLADRIKETYLGDRNIQVIHNGIDTEGIFYPRGRQDSLREKYGIAPDARLVLAVAPKIMDVQKGGQTVLDLAATMPGTQFVMVGADETTRYSDNVQLIARTKDQDELARWYSAADIFLICSKAENFPTTCIEALCCGTPVVGIDACGTKETAPAPYGTFVTRDENLLTSLAQAIESQQARGLTTEEIRQYAVDHYDNGVMYRQYLQYYVNYSEPSKIL